jgi:glucokinase
MPPAIAIGIDVGGTKVAGALVEIEGDGPDGARILDRHVVETPATDAEATAEVIAGVAREIASRHPEARALGVGAAGMVDLQGVMRFAPNVAWRELPLAARLREQVGLPTFVDNDANAAAWGEYRFGAGRGCSDMLLVTVGTGIGGGVVADGELFRGAHGFAAEIGHVIVEPGGPLCGCGNLGCWEQMASGRAIDRMGRAAAVEFPQSLMVSLAGGDPSDVTGTAVTQAARQGDPVAVRILAEVGRRLGEGIAGLVNILDPDTVVVGGGAIAAGELLLAPAREAADRAIEGAAYRPPVPLVAATLGNDAGMVGAADLANRQAR